MSVYTAVTKSELEKFISNYTVGELKSFTGITEGIENTNYFVSTVQGEYVLTIFETLSYAALPYYVELMAYFNEHAIPSAHPIADLNGQYLKKLQNKPAILMQRLAGNSVLVPNVGHCENIGIILARMHIVGQSFSGYQQDLRGSEWRTHAGNTLLRKLTGDEAELLKSELDAQSTLDCMDLPQGVIHADLFRDNVLFSENRISGLLDFYNACNDSFLYDLAITVNDWCVNLNGSLDMRRASHLCQAYSSARTLTEQEIQLWPMMLRIAALRFWLSRLWSVYHPVSGPMTYLKNPAEFQQIILARRQEMPVLNDVWRE
jgi:homoserine kinase type II